MRRTDYAHYRDRYQGNIISERESHDMFAQAAYELARFERIYSIAEPEGHRKRIFITKSPLIYIIPNRAVALAIFLILFQPCLFE